MENRYRRLFWGIFGLLIFIVLFYMSYPFIEGIVYGIFIYYITRPVKRRIDTRTTHSGISSFLSLLIVFSLIIIPAFVATFYIVDVAYKGLPSIVEIIKDLMPTEYTSQINEFITNLQSIDFGYLLELIRKNDLQVIIIEPIKRITEGFFWFLFILFIALIVSFYLLRDAENLKHWVMDIIPETDKKLVDDYITHLNNSLDRIFVGIFMTMIITAIFALISLIILNAIAPPELRISNLAIILGIAILCGIFNLLPGIGIKIVWVPVALLLGLQAYFTGTIMSSLWFLILFVIVMSFVVDFIPDQILRPYICSGGVHTGLILLAFVFGTAVFGAKGLFLGPIILVTFTEFMRIVVPELIKRG